nr:hypothetical protein [uncultured Acetatifactor sp.]
MAFGTIQVVRAEPRKVSPSGKTRVPKPPKAAAAPKSNKAVPAPKPAKAAPAPKGQGVLEIMVIASTLAEADDFLCGVYFDLEHLLSGSGLSVYTRDLSAITRLVEIKQDLEACCSAPVGQESVRTIPEESEPLDGLEMTLGEFGRQTASLDLRFHCTTPAGLSAVGRGDAVWVLLGQDEDSRRMVAEVARQQPDQPVFWLIANFENQCVYPADIPSQTLGAQKRKAMCERLGVPRLSGDHAGFIQLYGGLEWIRRDSGSAVVGTHQRHREYTPTACHLPVYAAVEEAMGRNPELNVACGGLIEALRDVFASWKEQWEDWCVKYEPERGETEYETKI